MNIHKEFLDKILEVFKYTKSNSLFPLDISDVKKDI